MDFVSARTEVRRLMLLAAAALTIELVMMPELMFKLLTASREWSVLLQLLALLSPRFVVMLVLVLMCGPFRKTLWFSGFLVAYVALLVVQFFRAEVFVEWSSATAASGATLPYVAGVVGALLAFWIIRKSRSTVASAPGF